jgi:magnesium transporter
MNKQFLEQTSLISYSKESSEKKKFLSIEEIQLKDATETVKWLNTYGLKYRDSFKEIVRQNNLDDFLIKLLNDDDHPNKVIDLEDAFFVSVRILKTEQDSIDDEMMLFIASSNFVWSIQEKPGDHFGWIRERIELNTGIIRKKKADYLLFLIIESIIDNYQATYQISAGSQVDKMNTTNVNPTPEFTHQVEELKQKLFHFKRASMSLRDTIVKLEKVQIKGTRANYFSELKEQVNNLITDIDFDLQELESKINMIFSIQGHRLNEVMKTLTIFSVIFIPLTFMAGIYGMNFKNIPELKSQNGYFILLGIMVIITLLSVWYFRRKKWF